MSNIFYLWKKLQEAQLITKIGFETGDNKMRGDGMQEEAKAYEYFRQAMDAATIRHFTPAKITRNDKIEEDLTEKQRQVIKNLF